MTTATNSTNRIATPNPNGVVATPPQKQPGEPIGARELCDQLQAESRDAYRSMIFAIAEGRAFDKAAIRSTLAAVGIAADQMLLDLEIVQQRRKAAQQLSEANEQAKQLVALEKVKHDAAVALNKAQQEASEKCTRLAGDYQEAMHALQKANCLYEQARAEANRVIFGKTADPTINQQWHQVQNEIQNLQNLVAQRSRIAKERAKAEAIVGQTEPLVKGYLKRIFGQSAEVEMAPDRREAVTESEREFKAAKKKLEHLAQEEQRIAEAEKQLAALEKQAAALDQRRFDWRNCVLSIDRNNQ